MAGRILQFLLMDPFSIYQQQRIVLYRQQTQIHAHELIQSLNYMLLFISEKRKCEIVNLCKLQVSILKILSRS